MMRLIFLLFCLPLTVFAQVQEFQLKNGMTVLVKEDHRAPVVTSMLWYRVGSADEPNGKTGISHALEHMMFKGTKRFPDGSFSNIIAELGGRENAFTSRDYTAYYQVIAKEGLKTALTLEADRMRQLALKEIDFRKEIEVVKEERRWRTEDKPTAVTWEQFNSVAYQNNPYQHPVIGWMNDLDHLTLDDLKDWYERYYAPNNATLVVVGDVDADEVHLMAKRTFGRLKPSDLPKSKPRQDAVQRGQKQVTVKIPANVPYLMMGYQIPELTVTNNPEEMYALLVLGNVLDGGDSARIAKNIVRGKQLAASSGAGFNPFARYSGLFLLDGQPVDGVTIEQLKKALLDEVNQLKIEPVSEQELARIKAQVIADEIYQRDDIQHMATQYGALQTTGIGWQEAERYADRIKAVTAEQIMQVAKKYLLTDRLTVAVLEPDGKPMAKLRSNFTFRH